MVGNVGESTNLGQWGSTDSHSTQHAADADQPASEVDDAPHPPFTQDDEETLELFAMQAAIAIEHALLHRQSEALAIARERERIAMDLHDGIIQSIYAVGLTLDDGRYYLEQDPGVHAQVASTKP